jgi:hypothetical protein
VTCRPVVFIFYKLYLTKGVAEKFRDLQIAGKKLRTLQYADDFVLLVREESVLQGIVNTITEIGRCMELK